MDNKIAVCLGPKRDPYLKALLAAGIRFNENPSTLQGLTALMLTGGTDVDPGLYGEARHPETSRPDLRRDRLEIDLLCDALYRDIPILAICRGMQLLNVVLGGTLKQHIENHRRPDVEDAHPIEIREGTKLAAILKVGPYHVNSRHHQCVHWLGAGLVMAAKAPDGIIEAVELPEQRFVIAVQWHPEDRLDRPDGLDRRLFEAFAAAIRGVTSAVPA